MGGRKPIKTPDEIYEALKGLKFCDEEQKLLSWQDPVWDLGVYNLDSLLSKEYLYTYLKQNRNNLFNRLHDISDDGDKKTVKKRTPKDPNWSMSKPEKKLKSIRHSVHLSKKDWSGLGAHLKTYNARSYEVLEPGWADKIYYKIWKELELPCPFAFKCRINTNEVEPYLTIKGHCGECNADIHLYSETAPTDNGLNINVSAWDTRDIVHKKRRKLRQPTRKAIITEVNAKSTYTWRHEMANREMKFGGVEPAFLYSEEVLRKAKQLEKDTELQVRPAVRVVESLRELQLTSEFAESIRDYSENNFFVMYWLPEQVTLHNEHIKKDKVGSVSFDASGKFCKPPDPNNPGKVIYLYQGITSTGVPIFQMLSSRHYSNWLAYSFREFLRSGAHTPKQFVSDFSLALLNAGALAFNEKRLSKYVDDCFQQLQSALPVPQSEKMCMLRLDIAHVIKLVTRWPCFTKNLPLKHFFVRCVGILTTVTALPEFERLLIDILCVAFSEQDGHEKDDHSCCNSRRRLMNLIKGNETKVNENDEHLCVESNDFETSLIEKKDTKRPILKFLSQIEQVAKRSVNKSGERNLFFSPDFAKRLLALSEYMVLWTATIAYLYDDVKIHQYKNLYTATSAASESYFRTLKHCVFAGGPERADKVMIQHLKVLSGTVKLRGVEQESIRRTKNKANVVFNESSALEDSLDFSDKSQHTSLPPESEFKFRQLELPPESESEFRQVTAEKTNVLPELQPGSIYLTNVAEKTNNFGESIEVQELSSLSETEMLLAKPQADAENNSENLPCAFDTTIPPSTALAREQIDNNSENLEDTPEFESTRIEIPLFPPNQKRKASTAASKPSSSKPRKVLSDITLDAHAYLQEEEKWMGLNKTNKQNEQKKQEPMKQRGLYIRSCPDIDHRVKNPTIARKLPLLTNGNSLTYVKTDWGLRKIENTCAFDALAHSVRCGMVDWPQYIARTKDAGSPFMSFIRDFAEKGPSVKLYQRRANMLIPMTPYVRNTNNSAVVKCDINIGQLATALFDKEPSAIRHLECDMCQDQESEKVAVLTPDLRPLYTNGLAGLQESLNKEDDNFKRTCSKCKRPKNIWSAGGSHLIVDIEALQWSLVAHRDGYKRPYKKTFALEDIPVDIQFKNSAYRLTSAIEFIGGGTGHYRPFVRRLTGRWEDHDGLMTASVTKKALKATRFEARKFHVLFFVKL